MSESLLIIRPGAIGDTLLTFPILRALKGQKQAHIVLVGNPTVMPLAQVFGLADAIYDYGALAWGELFSQSGIRSPFLLDILQQTNGVICWLRDPDGIVEHNLYRAGVTRVIIAPGRPDETSNVHIVDYLAKTLVGTDYAVSVKNKGIENLTGDSKLRSERESLVRTVAIHPGSGGAIKCWPISHFASVITNLWQQDISVLLLAGPADTERLATLLKLLGTPPMPSLLKVIAHVPLLEVAMQLKWCGIYLGNDSGITHLAAMIGVPTIVLFGPSNPNVWQPVGLNIRVLYNPRLEDIQVETVLKTLMTIGNLS